MIMDATGLFSEKQPITATTTSTNIIDLGATGTPYYASAPIVRDVGKGRQVPLFCGAVETFNNLTSLTIAVQVDVTAAFSTATTVYTSQAYTAAQLATGAKYLLPDSLPVGTNQRFVQLVYTVTGTAPTTGRITAGVVMSRATA